MSEATHSPYTFGNAGVRCMIMRGGTSKGAYFLPDDLPDDIAERDDFLLRVMGTPDPRQIDGIGGAHPLTSKVAVVGLSSTPDTDLDYLFLQVGVGDPTVTDRQNCGNLLAGVGPFAVERGLIAAGTDTTTVRINMLNTGSVAIETFETPGGVVNYDGELAVDGVPGTAAPISITFEQTAGSSTGALLPTGHLRDHVRGIDVTCIDNGMPSVMMAAGDLGVTGRESPTALERDVDLAARIAEIRVDAAALMGMGDVSSATVPKMVLLAPPENGGAIATRSFIPVRVHTAIGVLGATTVAAAIQLDGAVGHDFARLPAKSGQRLTIEHPTGHLDVIVDVDPTGRKGDETTSTVLRTARKLFDGTVFPRTRI